jgi:hypothetical protein
MSKWFSADKAGLNLGKTNITIFIANNSPQVPLNSAYNDEYTEESLKTKFLCLQVDNHLQWKTYID